MAIRISRHLFGERKIPLGGDVSFTFRPIGYSDFRQMDAMSVRMARQRLGDLDQVRLEVEDDEDLGPEFNDRLIGISAEIMLDALIIGFSTGWHGVQIDDDKDPDLTPENWMLFREENPGVAYVLHRKIEAPFRTVAAEGNGYAPLPTGNTPVV